MPTIILVLGGLLILAGLVAIFTVPRREPASLESRPGAESFLGDLRGVLEQLNSFLDRFEQRFRLGVLLVTLGAGLVGLAGYLEAKQAKDDAKDATKATAALVVRTR